MESSMIKEYSHSILLRLFITLFVPSFLLTACGDIPLRQWSSYHQQVVDDEIGKPLKNVVVLARWIGEKSMLVDTQGTCYHVETATTDKSGWFEIPSYNEGLGKMSIYNKRIDLSYYKEGYFFDARVMHDFMPKKRKMKLFVGTKEERFKYLSNFYTSCREAGSSNKNAHNINKSLYEEAKKIAVNKKQMKTLNFMLLNIEIIKFGYEDANKNLERRLDADK